MQMVKSQIKNNYTLCPALKMFYFFASIATLALAVVTPWFQYTCEVFKYDIHTISKGPIYIFNEILGFEGPLTLFGADGSLDILMLIGPAFMAVAVVLILVSAGLMFKSKTTSALVLNLLSVVSTIASIIATGAIEFSVLDKNLTRFSFVLDEIELIGVGPYPGPALDYLGFALAFLVLISIAVWAFFVNVNNKEEVNVSVVKYSFGEVLKPAMKTWAYALPMLFGLFTAAAVIISMTMVPFIIFLGVVTLFVGYMFMLAKAKLALASVRGEQNNAKTFFSVWNKEKFGTRLGGILWYQFILLLWFSIPIVGIVFGIIKCYQYRYVPYILVDNQNISATDALKLSKKMAYGNKGKMFAIDMATLGAVILVVALLALITFVPFLGTIGTIYFAVAVAIAIIFAETYAFCVSAQEYNLAKEKYEEVE